MDGSETKRIMILGKTGVGKSSLANTIFGEQLFPTNLSNSSQHRIISLTKSAVNGGIITLVDTHDFFDTDRSEIVRCITECAPGPHAFLIVLTVGRFTEEDQAVINKMQEYFSEEAFKYATVVFTCGNQLPEDMTIMDVVHQNTPVHDLVRKCGGRCHVIANKYRRGNPKNEYTSNQVQVEELLKTIDKMVEDNNGGCYTCEMLMSDGEIREKVEVGFLEKLWIKLAGVDTVSLFV